jgi:hypothetical protein
MTKRYQLRIYLYFGVAYWQGQVARLKETKSGVAKRRELDSLGSEVGTSDPYALYGGSYGRMVGKDSLYVDAGNPFDVAGECKLLRR